MSYFFENMKLFANKLGKFWFFYYSFTKKEKDSPTAIWQLPQPPPLPKNFFMWIRVSKFLQIV